MNLPSFETPENRRAWAFAALCGASFVFTVFAAVAVWLLSGNAKYTFYLGLAAHAQLMLCLGAISALLVRRTLSVSKDGITMKDDEVQP